MLVASVVGLVHDAPRPVSAQSGLPGLPPEVAVELVALGHVTDGVDAYLERARDVTVLTHGGKTYAAVTGGSRGPHLLDITDPSNIDRLSLANRRDINNDFNFNNFNPGSGGVAMEHYFDSSGRPHFIFGWGNSAALQAFKIRQSADTIGADACPRADGRIPPGASVCLSQVGRLMLANEPHSRVINTSLLQGINDLFIYSVGAKKYAVTVSASRNNLVTADVTDPDNLGSALTDGGSIGDNGDRVLNGAISSAYYQRGGKHYAVVASDGDDEGIQIVDISDATSPTAAGSLRDNGALLLEGLNGIDVWTVGSRSYAAAVAGKDDGLQIVDITDPTDLRPAGQLKNGADVLLDDPKEVKVMAIEDRFYAAVAASAEDGVSLIDVTDPYNPVAAASIRDGQNGASELDEANAVATYSADGRHFIVVAAISDNGVQILEIKTRANTGVLDPAFGVGGTASAAFGQSVSEVFDVVEQRDGKVVAVGYAAGNYTACDSTPRSTRDFALVRYNADGSLDASFGVGGRVLTNFTGSGGAVISNLALGSVDQINDIAIDTSGRIVAAGFSGTSWALARYSTAGVLDDTFGQTNATARDGSGSGGAVISNLALGSVCHIKPRQFFSAVDRCGGAVRQQDHRRRVLHPRHRPRRCCYGAGQRSRG